MSTIDVMLDEGAYMPTRAHFFDGGLDLRTPKKVLVKAHGNAIIDTGVHVAIPYYYVGLLKSKSGLNVKHNIVGEGVIDADYTGSIVVKLYNLGDEDYEFEAGDKIVQLLIVNCLLCEPRIVNQLGDAPRGNKGFGSTGR